MKTKDDKNIYDMLNDIEVDLSEYEKENFNDIEKMRIKKKFRKSIGKKNINNNYKKYISVASVVVVSLGIVSLTPVGTYASKIISDLVFDIKSALGIGVEEEGYIKIINKSISKDSITVRLNEAILNDDELIVSLTTISEKNIEKNESFWREKSPKLYINGELVDTIASGSLSQVSKKNTDEVIFFRLDTNKYSGIIDIRLEIDSVGKYKNETIKQEFIQGPFIFEFDFDTTKINKDIKEVEINKVIDLKNGEKITLETFVYTPLIQKILLTQNDIAIDNELDVILKGTDNLGNKVEFDIYHSENNKFQLIANTTNNKIDKNTKYINLTAYKRILVNNGKEIKTKLEEIEKNIKINLDYKTK